MACFIVPATEAIATTIIRHTIQKHEQPVSNKISFSCKLGWLNKLLWGGSALLAFEHVWHGEVVPYFPFLTAAGNPEDCAEMLHEMATSGVAMAVLVTMVWVGMSVLADWLVKQKIRPENIMGESV